ncbi:MAG: FAD-dependent oxidoreductase [Myxococcota bacterium]|jgi:ferredoxin-NADP reductase
MPQPVKIRAVIASIVEHSPGLKTFILRPDRPVPRFHPGQFLHLAIDPYDPSQHWPESRVFSIASPPEQRSEIRITVSAVGRFTRRMMQLESGEAVWIKLPYGEFVFDLSNRGPAILLAGGTGVAPFISWLGSATCRLDDITLLYGVRSPEMLIYRQAADEAKGRCPAFRWIPFIESGEMPGAVVGRLTAGVAVDEAVCRGGLASAVFYLSGPPAMLSALREDLSRAGVRPEAIRQDSWE